MTILDRESATVRISTHSFFDRRRSTVEGQARMGFEVAVEAGHSVVTSLPVEQE
jgi:hypothetical protein